MPSSPISTPAATLTPASAHMAAKQRVVVMLPSNVDLANLDFIQVTDAASHALGQRVDLSDLVLTVAQTTLVQARAHVCTKCSHRGQHEPVVDASEVGTTSSSSASTSVIAEVAPLPVAASPTEPTVGSGSATPSTDNTGKLPAEAPVPRPVVPSTAKEQDMMKPAKKGVRKRFDKALARLSVLESGTEASATDQLAKPKPAATVPKKSPVSAVQLAHEKQPILRSTLSILDPSVPDDCAAAIPSCLLFPADQSSLVADVAKEEEAKLKEMEELDPVDVNYFLRLLQGDGAAAVGTESKRVKKQVKKDRKAGAMSDDDDTMGMDAVERLRFKFMETLADDSDNGFGVSDDDDLSI